LSFFLEQLVTTSVITTKDKDIFKAAFNGIHFKISNSVSLFLGKN